MLSRSCLIHALESYTVFSSPSPLQIKLVLCINMNMLDQEGWISVCQLNLMLLLIEQKVVESGLLSSAALVSSSAIAVMVVHNVNL
ncbi:hypothetical protein L6452_14869 [Arctium lappa]|uniref:Uncharacterized protein n=1 Tax=Arctium lappa TaxID=4217 RepID=A0ACB9CMA2_ARCLA|nr:hypothetical protein L6452_14869 [Arctium lappa]